MGVADNTWRRTAGLGLWLMLAACGSGNLGTISASAAAPGDGRPVMTDAGAAREFELRRTPDAGPVGVSEPVSACGDGIVQVSSGEQCDGRDLGGKTCQNLGIGSGVLTCDPASCRLVIAQCIQTPPMHDGGADAGNSQDGGRTPPTMQSSCPTGFLCVAGIVQTPSCAQWGEEVPPLCRTPGSLSECSWLPGSTCTQTSVGMYCVLPCTP